MNRSMACASIHVYCMNPSMEYENAPRYDLCKQSKRKKTWQCILKENPSKQKVHSQVVSVGIPCKLLGAMVARQGFLVLGIRSRCNIWGRARNQVSNCDVPTCPLIVSPNTGHKLCVFQLPSIDNINIINNRAPGHVSF